LRAPSERSGEDIASPKRWTTDMMLDVGRLGLVPDMQPEGATGSKGHSMPKPAQTERSAEAPTSTLLPGHRGHRAGDHDAELRRDTACSDPAHWQRRPSGRACREEPCRSRTSRPTFVRPVMPFVIGGDTLGSSNGSSNVRNATGPRQQGSFGCAGIPRGRACQTRGTHGPIAQPPAVGLHVDACATENSPPEPARSDGTRVDRGGLARVGDRQPLASNASRSAWSPE
jgi:hypothetical protein